MTSLPISGGSAESAPITAKPATARLVTPLLTSVVLMGLLLCSQPLLAFQTRIVGGELSTQGDWPFMAALMYRYTGVTMDSDPEEEMRATFLSNSTQEFFSGELVDCGPAASECVGVRNNICLIARDHEIFFQDKAKNCEAGGGRGALIYNDVDEGGGFQLDEGYQGIPAAYVSRVDGEELLTRVGQSVSFGYIDETPAGSFCGGAYIGNGWVLTAAHCVSTSGADSLKISLGDGDLQNPLGQYTSNVSEVYVHSDYEPEEVRYDFGLIRLENAPSGVTPVNLPTSSQIAQVIDLERSGVAIGRGQQDAVDITSNDYTAGVSRLYEVDMRFRSNASCNDGYNNLPFNRRLATSNPVTSEMLCASGVKNSTGTCFGDSGGPLVYEENNRTYLAGITSWGLGCAQPEIYDVFSRVSSITSMTNAALAGRTIPAKKILLTGPSDAAVQDSAGSADGTSDESSGGGGLGLLALSLLSGTAMLRRKNLKVVEAGKV